MEKVTVAYPKVSYTQSNYIIKWKLALYVKWFRTYIIYVQYCFVGSTLCQDIPWCRIVTCIICFIFYPFILLLNCIHGPNPDGTAWIDAYCCCDKARECLQSEDASSYTSLTPPPSYASLDETTPLITPVVNH